MANQEQLNILEKGVDFWNSWRNRNPDTEIDLYNAWLQDRDLSEINLSGANLRDTYMNRSNLSRANLKGADLSSSKLYETNLSEANLSGANLYFAIPTNANLKGADLSFANLNYAFLSISNLSEVNLYGANLENAKLDDSNLSGANLSKANLTQANLYRSNFSGANLDEAELTRATLVESNFTNASIIGAKVYGISVWNNITLGLKQNNLILSTDNEPILTVDDIEVAQFIYLMLNNDKIRNVLGTIAKKGVLILGRFTPERKKILDAIRDKLRELDFLPMMFDFEKVSSKDFTETIKILAGMSRFVIADISNPSSSPLELQATLPDYKIPFVPIIEAGQRPFAMFRDLTIYPWCLEVIQYDTEETLIKFFQKAIIDRALETERKLLELKATTIQLKNISDF